jgi:hypothetical protein
VVSLPLREPAQEEIHRRGGARFVGRPAQKATAGIHAGGFVLSKARQLYRRFFFPSMASTGE